MAFFVWLICHASMTPNLKYSKSIFTCSRLKQVPCRLHVRRPRYMCISAFSLINSMWSTIVHFWRTYDVGGICFSSCSHISLLQANSNPCMPHSSCSTCFRYCYDFPCSWWTIMHLKLTFPCMAHPLLNCWLKVSNAFISAHFCPDAWKTYIFLPFVPTAWEGNRKCGSVE